MDLKITQKGVFNAEGKELPIGEVVAVEGDKVPGNLVGKAFVVNPAVDKKADDKADDKKAPAASNKKA